MGKAQFLIYFQQNLCEYLRQLVKEEWELEGVLNWKLSRWVASKFKRVNSRQRCAKNWLGKMAQSKPKLFVHWQIGIIPTVR